eukprot:TRINITY_DN27301_c0_g1_i1.p1 TRINITY_DN27301_c0_g1~~TRINITY_DN27301_c0_g1_i1.p1  ORF type:complete len:158 (-),score=39.93 TRINITY_DN27301_c0_g1_i1:191-664(-)
MEFTDGASQVILPEAPLPGEALPSVDNNPQIEQQWAVTACAHADTYLKLISTFKDHKSLRLTKIDEEIYTSFRALFPKVRVDTIDEDEMKSPESKKIWAPFLESFKTKVDLYNFLTLLRKDSTGDYSEHNTIVVPRVQFFCFEIARLREGHNSNIRL